MFSIELSPNFEYLITLPGFGKLLTVIFGVIAIGLGGHSQEQNLDLWKEELFLMVTVLCFIISCIYLVGFCFSDQLVVSKINKLFDIMFHIAAGVFEMTVGSLMLNSAVDLNQTECKFPSPAYCEYFDDKIGAGVFAILNGVVYFGTAVAIYKVKGL